MITLVGPGTHHGGKEISVHVSRFVLLYAHRGALGKGPPQPPVALGHLVAAAGVAAISLSLPSSGGCRSWPGELSPCRYNKTRV